MALMMGDLYEALREGGARDDRARRAAEEVASYDDRFGKPQSEVSLVTWMVGFNLALTAAVLAKLLI